MDTSQFSQQLLTGQEIIQEEAKDQIMQSSLPLEKLTESEFLNQEIKI